VVPEHLDAIVPRDEGRTSNHRGLSGATVEPAGSGDRLPPCNAIAPARKWQSVDEVRVLVVDAQQAVAESLARVLADEPDLVVVGTATTETCAVELAHRERPDVAVVDQPQIALRLRPSTRTVLLAAGIDDRSVRDAVDAGCRGFATKDGPVADIVLAVRRAASGDAAFDPALLAHLVAMLGPHTQSVGSDLTAREHEVLRRLADGCGNRAIAEELHISVNTVRNYVQSILGKLKAHSKLEAVAIATREGLITRSERPATGRPVP
jgi:two-component system nitrate/nitrite response regulator NarL